MGLINDADYSVIKAATEAGKDEALRDQAVHFLAELLPFGFILAAALIFWSGNTPKRKERAQDTVLAAIGAVLLAVGARWLIGEVWFRERPFVTHQLHHLDLVSPDANSFPSLHAMMLFAFAGTVAFIGSFPKWGRVLLACAAIVAVARVFAGVHYVTDVIIGAAAGLGIAKLVSWQSATLAKEMR